MSTHRGKGANFHHEILGPELVRQGHDVSIVTTSHPGGTRVTQENGMTVYYLEGTPPDQYSSEYWKASARKFDELHASVPFDAVISESEGAYGFVRYSTYSGDVPLVHVKHNTLSTMREHFEFGWNVRGLLRYAYYLQHHVWFFNRVTKPLMNAADAIVCNSNPLARSLVDDHPSVGDKVTVVHLGIDVDTFARGDHDKLDLPEPLADTSKKVVLYIGRISREKGVKYLIEATEHVQLDDFHLLIIGSGDGEYVEEIRASAESSPIRERMHFVEGGTAYENVPHYLDRADVLVIPSVHDTFPMIALEAMASGTPIVATAVGGIPEMIDDGENGLLVPRKDPVRLASAIKRLLDDPERRETLGENAANRAIRRYSITSMAENTARVVERLVREQDEA